MGWILLEAGQLPCVCVTVGERGEGKGERQSGRGKRWVGTRLQTAASGSQLSLFSLQLRPQEVRVQEREWVWLGVWLGPREVGVQGRKGAWVSSLFASWEPAPQAAVKISILPSLPLFLLLLLLLLLLPHHLLLLPPPALQRSRLGRTGRLSCSQSLYWSC